MARTPRPITVTQRIAAPPQDVWGLISAPGHLAQCHPFCAANPVHVWDGVGSHDTIEYYNGRVVDRRFMAWLEGEGYDLDVSDSAGPLASVSWRLAPDGAGTSLSISLTPLMLSAMLRGIRGLTSLGVMRPMMLRYLRSVLRGIEYRVTTGQPVMRNQFGAHRWFSART